MLTPYFDLKKESAYQQWRHHKLAAYPVSSAELFTEINDPSQLTAAELTQLRQTVQRYNFALYRSPSSDTTDNKDWLHPLAKRMGLKRLHANLCADEDSLSAIQVGQHTGQHDYIPYTNKPLSWHTDGYYHPPAEAIQGMLLHCVRPAVAGGENQLMDHEIAYILLRDANPAYITALMHPEALTIPANILNGEVIRPTQTGPVFSVTPAGYLHMRYSARQRNVRWRADEATQAAADFLLQLWQQVSPYRIHYTLQAGEGLLCNNVLHCRTNFTDAVEADKKRLLYRGRYLDRVA